jgi:cytochrome P450
MAWMMHFMLEHPDVQARMQTEAGQVVGNAGMLTQLQDAERLNYIEAVTHEAMRLKPVAPIIFLESIEDVVIGGVAVPKEIALMLLTLHGGLQEIHFAAADEFRPERWLEAGPRLPAHNTKAFVPFGVGPRYCPGRQLAMVEIKAVMAMLCAAFDISKTDQAQPVGEIFSFTMMPENLFVRFNRRQAM